MLTDSKARSAIADRRPRKLSDGGGLYLHIRPTGSKYWRLAYRFNGKQKLLAIGVYPEVSLAKARKARQDARDNLALGVDPGENKKESKRKARESSANTFEAVAREWHETKRDWWTAGHAKKIIDSLRSNIFPGIGMLPIDAISPIVLLATIKKIEKRGALDVAGRVLQRCSAVFRYGVVTGKCSTNPAADLRGAMKPLPTHHYKSLSEQDLPEFFQRLDTYDGQLQTKLGLQILAYTFVRTGELRAADWSEIDFELAEWRIPAERMKMRVAHIVPLSHQCLQYFEELRKSSTGEGYIFTNQKNRKKCMSENTLLFALYRMGYHSRATGHGFRATASTMLNERGYKPDVIERQLAHVEGNKVRKAYNHAEYLEDRKVMMQDWADLLDSFAHHRGECGWNAARAT